MTHDDLKKQLFELADSLGEGIFGSVHIINQSEMFGAKKYRIYHGSGYCWDISEQDAAETGYESEPEMCYTFFENWEGFGVSGIAYAFCCLEAIYNELHGLKAQEKFEEGDLVLYVPNHATGPDDDICEKGQVSKVEGEKVWVRFKGVTGQLTPIKNLRKR